MQQSTSADDDEERLLSLLTYSDLDTRLSPKFDNLVRLTATALRVPIAVASLVGKDRHWLLSCEGIDASSVSRRCVFGAHVVRAGGVLVVPDASCDERFADDEMVSGANAVRFFAGAPLVTPTGHCIGALCVFDTETRSEFFDVERSMLQTLAAAVIDQLELARVANDERRKDEDLRRYYEVMGASTDFMGVAHSDGRVIGVNPAGRAMTGYSEDESLAGLTIGAFHAPEWIERITRVAIPTAMENGSWRGEGELLTRDGSRIPVDQVVLCHRDEDGEVKFVSTIARDISDKLELARLRERQVMRDALVAAVSHELRTPLTSIVAALDMVGDGVLGEVPDPVAEVLQIARGNSERLLGLIDRLLEFGKARAKIQDLTLSTVPLRSIIDRALGVVRVDGMSKHITLTTECNDICDLLIECDAIRIEQVVVNLVSNALKVSDPGSTVRVGVERSVSTVCISVSDDGPGIAPDDLPLLFEPFWQGPTGAARVEGSGLGLAICKEIIRGHDGTLDVRSELGVGTTFTVCIPMTQSPAD